MKIFQVIKRIYHKVVDSFSLFKPLIPRHNRRATLPSRPPSRKEKISIKYRPMKEVHTILFPKARYLYVVTYRLQSSGYRSFYVEAGHRLTETELKEASSQKMIGMIEDNTYRYNDDDMPIASSMELAVAYKRE